MSVSSNQNQNILRGEYWLDASPTRSRVVPPSTDFWLGSTGGQGAPARVRFAVALACVAFLTYLLLSQEPWSLLRAFPKEMTRALKHGVIDKAYHLVSYFGLTCILLWYVSRRARCTFYGVAVAVAVHAIATESLQQFVPRRSADVNDLVANLLGVAAGVVVGILIRRLRLARYVESVDDFDSAPLSDCHTAERQPLEASFPRLRIYSGI